MTHPNYESVFAETTIPNSMEIDTLEIIDNSNGSDTIFYNATLKLRFNDNLVTGALLTLNQKTIHFYASLKELSTPPDFKSKVA